MKAQEWSYLFHVEAGGYVPHRQHRVGSMSPMQMCLFDSAW
jgi:hypothetical protein